MTNKQELQIQDLKYKIHHSQKQIPQLEIIHNNEIIPKTLSKYYSLTDYSIDAFLKNRIYLAQLNQMNDLFEPNSKSFRFETLTVDDLVAYGIIAEEDYEEEMRMSQNDPNYFIEVVNTIYLNFMLRFGVLCTTPNQKDDLMWAHYSNNSGFLIEFDYSHFPKHFFGPFPINYCKKTQIDIKEVDWSLAFYIESLTKKEVWKYENEYRFIFYPQDEGTQFKVGGLWSIEKEDLTQVERYVNYPNTAIIKVILGIKILEGGNLISLLSNRQVVQFSDFKKIALFSKLSSSNYKIEAIGQRPENYELVTTPLKISKVCVDTFEIEYLP